MKLDFEKVQFKRKYTFGAQYDHGAERHYEYVIVYPDTHIDGKVFYGMLWTPRHKKSRKWGEGKMIFKADAARGKPEFKNIKEVIQHIWDRSMRVV